jgi:hypothetical protein
MPDCSRAQVASAFANWNTSASCTMNLVNAYLVQFLSCPDPCLSSGFLCSVWDNHLLPGFKEAPQVILLRYRDFGSILSCERACVVGVWKRVHIHDCKIDDVGEKAKGLTETQKVALSWHLMGFYGFEMTRGESEANSKHTVRVNLRSGRTVTVEMQTHRLIHENM